MSVQLKEPCIRSLSRYYNLKARVQGNLYKPSPTLFRLHYVYTKAQLYTTAALRTMEDKSTAARLQPSLMKKQQHGDTWTEYQTLYKDSPRTLDTKKYEQVLIQLSEGTESVDRWTCITRAFEDARQLDIQPTPITYLLAVTAYGRSNQLEKTVSTFREYKSHNRVRKGAYLRYMKALLQCKGGEMEAHRVWRECSLKKEGSLCLAELVQHCSRTGHMWIAIKAAGDFRRTTTAEWDKEALERVTQSLWNGYAQLLSSPEDAYKDPGLVEAFVDKYVEMSKREPKKRLWMPDNVMTLLDLTPLSPTTKTCDQLLALYASRKHFSGLKSVLSMMQQCQVQPSSHTISLLLGVFGSSLKEGETHSFYNALKSSGQLDLDLYKVFIKVFTNAMDTKQATQVIHDIRREGHQLDESFAFAMVQNFVRQGKTQEAVDWLKQHSYRDANLDPYALIMESWLSQGQWDHCIAQYKSLKKDGVGAVDQNRRIVKALVTAASARGDWTHCENILNQLEIQFTPTTVSRIIDTLIHLKQGNNKPWVTGKRIVKALQSIEKTLHMPLTADNIGKVISSLGERGDCEDAYALYRWTRGDNGEDLDWVYTASNRCSSRYIYNAMMETAVECNDMKKLERAWVDMQYRDRFDTDGIPAHTCMKKQSIPVSTYNILLNGYASRLPRPDITRIKRIFRKMVDQGISPNTVSYNILIKAFIATNHLESAKQIFEEMVRSGNPPDSWSLNTLLNGWIQRKDWPSVEKFVQELKSSNTLNENVDIVTFNLLVQGFLRLDSKYNPHKALQKRRHNWAIYRQIKEEEAKHCEPLPSKTIWNIFETTTGYTKQTVESKLHIPKENNTPSDDNDSPFSVVFKKLISTQSPRIPDEKAIEKPFIHLFKSGKRKLEPDDVTYTLFMRAFINNRDYKSASKIYEWMRQRGY